MTIRKKWPPEALVFPWRKALRVAAFLTIAGAGLMGCESTRSGSKQPVRKDLLKLRISEIHYHPADQDTIPGDEYEFIEIGNTGEASLDLTDVGFTEGITYNFKSGTKIAAGEFVVLAANAARFKERYGFAPFDVFTGKLSNAGELIALTDMRGDSAIASVTYSDIAPWPVGADGAGYSLVPIKLSESATGASGWKTSFTWNGNPGKADPVAVLINEVSTHTDPPAHDAIELYNPNAYEVDIGGWYLSDDRAELLKYRIPSGVKIPAGGYKVFDSSAFNANPESPTAFSLSAHGDQVYLSADSTGCKGFCHGFVYGEIENGVTFGRYVNLAGEEHFVEQKSATLGAANSGPRVGPVVISEIMYHPMNDSDEYVEIANITTDSVALFDKAFPENTWKVKGFGFTFPVGITLAPKEVVLILSASTPKDAFRKANGLSDSVRLFAATARLSNDTDTLSLLQPQEPYEDGQGLVVPYKLVERVAYRDSGRWPNSPDGLGQSLIRKDRKAYGNDPENWKGDIPTPGL